VATIDGQVLRTGAPWAWLAAGLASMGVLFLGALVGGARRRRRRSVDADLSRVPVVIQALVKEYSDGYRAVDDVSFRVERGQVVGLLGPNGAGKTTTLRVLMGLIRPTSGTVRVFGELVDAGAPVLSRIGAFIEGPGLLPHLSGRDNLRLFWAATGRPAADAEFDTALEIAGLGASVDRRVRTFSQGMRQRLAIAQSMLGLPELLVLDEPTNGLDPLQIAEMREVLRRYATTGPYRRDLQPSAGRGRADLQSRGRDAQRQAGRHWVGGRDRRHRHDAAGRERSRAGTGDSGRGRCRLTYGIGPSLSGGHLHPDGWRRPMTAPAAGTPDPECHPAPTRRGVHSRLMQLAPVHDNGFRPERTLRVRVEVRSPAAPTAHPAEPCSSCSCCR